MVWSGWVTTLRDRNMRDWPITRDELTSWYDTAAAELGRPALISSWEAPAVDGFLCRPFSIADPNRYGEESGKGIWSADSVHVLLNATLSHLHPSADRRGIERVTLYSDLAGQATFDISPNQRVVLAAGGMGNAQILLGSEDGNGAAVGNENDQVGRYLMEHPHIYDCATLVVRAGFSFPSPPETFGDFYPALIPNDASFEAVGRLDASFQFTNSRLDDEDAIGHYVVGRLGVGATVLSLNARTEMKADPENRVERVRGTDPAGLPRLRATCVFNARDYRSVLTYLQILGESLGDRNIGRLQIHNDALFSNATGGGHILGTTRMGDNPSMSVTDRDCRVHGYENLFVAGSSLFSTGGYANPTMTIIALAARLGEYLGSQ